MNARILYQLSRRDFINIQLQGYELEKILIAEEVSAGKPALLQAQDSNSGQRVVIKYWSRLPEIDDSDLRDIWLHEIRQLHRLSAVSSAEDLLISMGEARAEDSGFYIVLITHNLSPLALSSRSPSRTLSLPDKQKALTWRNLHRIAKGLGLLHDQGILHRNLDEWSVFTAMDSEPDFRLSGFEFSVRITTQNSFLKADNPLTSEQHPYSFQHDWYAFGQLACELLGVDPQSIASGNFKSAFLPPKACRLLHSLLNPADRLSLDGNLVGDQVDAICEYYEKKPSAREQAFLVACEQRVIDGTLEPLDDYQTLHTTSDWIKAVESDLIDAILIKVAPRRRSHATWWLAGRKLMYALRDIKLNGSSFAHGKRCTLARPLKLGDLAIRSSQRLKRNCIRVSPLREVQDNLYDVEREYCNWEAITWKSERNIPTEDNTVWLATALLQYLQAVMASTLAWPITLTRLDSQSSDRYRIEIRSREDEKRYVLAASLGLKNPAEQLRRALTEELLDTECDWSISRTGNLNDRGEDNPTARWTLVGSDDVGLSNERFVLESDQLPPVDGECFLRNADYEGSEFLLKRQIRSLSKFRENSALQRAFQSLADVTQRSNDEFGTIDKELDRSKHDALAEIFEVIPLYLLQGPPGVGKTRLLGELVRNRFSIEPESQLLLSAQNHETVDHLLEEVISRVNEMDLLAIRTESPNRRTTSDQFVLSKHVEQVQKSVRGSLLASDLPATLRSALNLNERDDRSRQEEGAIGEILLRSANLLFSTINARELEQLARDRYQFDWSIVEEAGRATVTELLTPLMLSHRRLLIGDHKQLPPFGADNIDSMLSNSENVLKAISDGREYVSKLFGELDLHDWTTLQNFNSVCTEAKRLLVLFQSLYEEQNLAKDGDSLSVSATLLEQHRMHPTIAELVSTTFYDETLVTDPSCAARFEKRSPIYIRDRHRLPDSPIVVVDMPYQQSTLGARNIECRPNYHNPDEVKQVIEILKLICVERTASRCPSLAILTPYRQQARKLRYAIRQKQNTTLRHLESFQNPSGDNFVSTIDAFQGNEADIVIASFVRNNHHSSPGQRFGFLQDSRRMNVLISRAKWKLILVCSLQFIEGGQFSAGSSSNKIIEFQNIFKTIRRFSSDIHAIGANQASIVNPIGRRKRRKRSGSDSNSRRR